MVSASRKKAVNIRILFPIDKNSDSTSQNEGLFTKIRFHYAEKLLSPGVISRKTRQKWLPVVGESYCIKNGFTLI